MHVDGASKLTVDCPSNGVVSIRAASDIGANTNKVVVTVRDATKTKEREVTGHHQRFGDGQA